MTDTDTQASIMEPMTAAETGQHVLNELVWIAAFADIRSKDDSKVFARVNRGAMRTIAEKANAAIAQIDALNKRYEDGSAQ